MFGDLVVLPLYIQTRSALDHDFHSSLIMGGKEKKKRRVAHTAFSSPRNKSWKTKTRERERERERGEKKRSFRLRPVSPPGCVFTSTRLIHLLVGGWIGHKAEPPEINVERPDAWQAVCRALLQDWSCALGDALSTVALHESGGEKKNKKTNTNKQLSQTVQIILKASWVY